MHADTVARVEEALRRIPRAAFLPETSRGAAAVDAPVPIGRGQTMSAPHMVAIMLRALDARPGDRVLDVGTGSGWHAALLAHLVSPGGRVVSIEWHEPLAEHAREALAAFDLPVEVLVGDGSLGHPAGAPYDRISVAAGSPRIPPPLLEQLAEGGVLVLPVGPPGLHTLLRLTRREGRIVQEDLGACVFVPLLGKHGY